jgi:dienelactone hydrolase
VTRIPVSKEIESGELTMSFQRNSHRRSFIQRLWLWSLAALGLGGGSFLTARGESQKKRPLSGADIGTLYPEIMKLANRGRYPLSFLERDYANLSAYRRKVRSKVFDLFHYNPETVEPLAEVVERWEYPEYIQEKVLFSTTPWFRVPAYVLVPKGFTGLRPGIVDLHSHGGMFVFGKEKVMPMPGGDHPSIVEYRKRNYEGRSTSLELCRRGYVVISIDCFYFGERRTLFDREANYTFDRTTYSPEDVRFLNRRASTGEATLVTSLFWAGTTWQGIAHWDDIRTVDYLQSRSEVDPDRIGCLGISMGGDRTDYLAGLDERIKCAVSVGWMSTLRPMIKAHVDTHSFIHFLPGMAHYLDLPDLIGCMVPKPLMVQYCAQDALYPLDGMKEADQKIEQIYSKADASEKYKGRFYDLPHVFSQAMQEEAFDWLDRWL